jgi:hypothetical protein
MTRLLSVLAAGVFLTCSPADPAVPKPPVDEASDPTYCTAACKHLADLGCPEGEPVYNSDLPGPLDVPNQSCADWCKELQDRDAALNPRCLLLITDCTQIEEYRAKDPSTCELDGGV